MSEASSRSKVKKLGVCHYCGAKDHWMRNCSELAAKLKKRKADRKEKPTVNLIDNFESDEDDNSSDSDSELAVNLTELNKAEQSLITEATDDWYGDSGASKLVTGRKKLLSDIELGSSSKIGTIGEETLRVAGKGKVDIPTYSGGIKFDNLLSVLGVTKNLLSVGTIADSK